MLASARFGTKNIEAAKAFYDEIAALLGARRVYDMPNLAAYQSEGGAMFLIGLPFEGEASVGNGTQMGLDAPSRALVDQVYNKALELGGTCEGKPGIRGGNPDGFYGAYFRDLDGNKLTVFRYGPPDA
jgi:catechol 2,3-dioxygenase-like lactoylglutathione lyase family enzyme